MVTLGIDPGKRGALVWIDTAGNLMRMVKMPPRIGEVIGALEAHRPDFVAVERGVGVTFGSKGHHSQSYMFNYGKHCGELTGILRALRIPFVQVMPRTWQTLVGISANPGQPESPKARALRAAQRLQPGQSSIAPGGRTPHDGIIDAYLIAEWARLSRAAGELQDDPENVA